MIFVKDLDLRRMLVLSQWDKVVMTLAAACGTPFLFHAIPFLAGPELGMRWLPMFYAPLIACLFFRPHVSLIVGVGAPLINHVLFGMPNDRILPGLIFELVVFNAILALINAQARVRFWHIVPVFLGVRGLSLAVFGSPGISVVQIGQSWLLAWPGILILAVLAELFGRYSERAAR